VRGSMPDEVHLKGMRKEGGEPTWTIVPPWWSAETLLRHKSFRKTWRTRADADSAISLTLERARLLNARFARDARSSTEWAAGIEDLNRLLADDNAEKTHHVDVALREEKEPVDCCARPNLGPPAHRLVDENHDTASILTCAECGARWLSAWHEYLTFSDEGDLTWKWYALLTADEVAQLVALSGDRPDYRFLRGRPVIVIHEGKATMESGPPFWTL